LRQSGFGILRFSDIQDEISKDRPICARVAWDPDGDLIEDGAHFVAIVGWSQTNGVDFVHVEDPVGVGENSSHSMKLRVPFEMFKESYRGDGRWTHTYLMKG
jgi:hypothetical protein